MKKYRYYLRIKDSKGQWQSSERYSTLTELIAKYGKWIEEHPTVPFQVQREDYFVAPDDINTES